MKALFTLVLAFSAAQSAWAAGVLEKKIMLCQDGSSGELHGFSMTLYSDASGLSWSAHMFNQQNLDVLASASRVEPEMGNALFGRNDLMFISRKTSARRTFINCKPERALFNNAYVKALATYQGRNKF